RLGRWRFAGFSKDSKQLAAEVHCKYIHEGLCWKMRQKKYKSYFNEYIKRRTDADGIEGMCKKVHAAIRADPTQKKSEKQPPKEHKR
ncbi:unnamed protein product, partial [Thlaspi arvense]